MFDVFKKYILTKAALTAREIDMLHHASVTKKLRRKEFLLREGEVCRQYAFITKGCLRFYRISDDKTEHIIRFGIENWWMSDLHSIESQEPSKHYIDALESSIVLLWTKEDMERLSDEIPAFKALREQLIARFHKASLDRIFTGLSSTSEEKYEKFIATYPDIFNRVPLHMIASYLGVSRKTLTRIRVHYTTHGRIEK